MRAPIGDIVATGGVGLATGLLDECAAIATAEGFRPGSAAMDRSRAMLTAPESFLAASMFRDMERGSPIEGSYIVGDLLRRGQALSVAAPLLSVADAHLRAYEARRAREGSASP
jgi:2-dehydropantoate 2-reductase